MKIGLFDHIEDGARPLTTLFDERLQFVGTADRAGFYCYHVAEHHATPLNTVPVPGVYLGAVARSTRGSDLRIANDRADRVARAQRRGHVDMIDPHAVVADDLDMRHAIEQGTINERVAIGDNADGAGQSG